VRLNTSLRSQAIRAQLTVIEVKGQEPFHSGQGLVMVTALVSSEADGAQLMRLQWHDYRVLLGAQKAYGDRPEEWAKWEERYTASSNSDIPNTDLDLA